MKKSLVKIMFPLERAARTLDKFYGRRTTWHVPPSHEESYFHSRISRRGRVAPPPPSRRVDRLYTLSLAASIPII